MSIKSCRTCNWYWPNRTSYDQCCHGFGDFWPCDERGWCESWELDEEKAGRMTRRALAHACDELASVSGTCPYDVHNTDCTSWESDCGKRCDAHIDMGECWRYYFEWKAAMV